MDSKDTVVTDGEIKGHDDRPEWPECIIKWEVGDTAIDPTGFVLGTVVKVTPKGWPVVYIMDGIEEISMTAIKSRIKIY